MLQTWQWVCYGFFNDTAIESCPGCPGAAMERARWSSDCVAVGQMIPCCSPWKKNWIHKMLHLMLGKCLGNADFEKTSNFKDMSWFRCWIQAFDIVWFAIDFDETTNQSIYFMFGPWLGIHTFQESRSKASIVVLRVSQDCQWIGHVEVEGLEVWKCRYFLGRMMAEEQRGAAMCIFLCFFVAIKIGNVYGNVGQSGLRMFLEGIKIYRSREPKFPIDKIQTIMGCIQYASQQQVVVNGSRRLGGRPMGGHRFW